MNGGYWHQKAAPWVSIAVLAGGLASSFLLFWLVRMENRLQASDNFAGYEESL